MARSSSGEIFWPLSSSFSSLKVHADVPLDEFFVEEADEVAASVESSEAQKDIVLPKGGGWCNRRRHLE